MRSPWRAARAHAVAAWMLPSRCRCSSAFGRESMRQLRASRVDPRGEPVRTDISGGTGKLADQNNRGLVVKAIVVFVSIGFFSMAGVAIGQKDHFQSTVRG